MNRLVVRAPEGVEFSVALAGPASRFLALATDIAIISAGASILSRVFDLVSVLNDDLAKGLAMLIYFALTILYGMGTEWFWNGQTVGKRLLGLRVMDAAAGSLRPSQIVMRNLLRPIDALPLFYLTGAIACLVSRHSQRLGDFAAGTVVVRTEDLSPPDLDPILAGRFNSMLEHRHLAAQLRQRTPPALAALALTALLRRDRLEPPARIAVFASLAERFAGLVPFPPAAIDDLSPENYVRNAVEIVFRPQARRAVS